jgi:hypothetical protein
MFFKYLLFLYASVVNYFQEDKITKVDFEYEVDSEQVRALYGDFWHRERRWWNSDMISAHYTRVSRGEVTYIPKCVHNAYFHVKYTMAGRVYRFITEDTNIAYPPDDPSGNVMRFSLPIRQAILLDENDVVVRDVTKKMKQYHGPHGDYHRMDLPVKYMFFEDNYSKLRVINIINSVQTVEKSASIRRLL